MRKIYHLCRSSHSEVMFRNEADLIMGFNSLALAVLETDSRLIGEGFISTHHHKAVQTDSHRDLMRKERYTYTRYFNAKYSRRGSLGENVYFFMEVDGIHHLQTLLSYVLRQGLHHGLASTPFEYPHCSANTLFRKELGKDFTPPLIIGENRYQYLPEHRSVPVRYRMSDSGLLLREDIVDKEYAEEIYVTPRNFLFHMNRLTDEKDLADQRQENTLPPVTIDTVEHGVPGFDSKEALKFEQGRVNKTLMTDLELCHIIDDMIVPRFFKDNEKQSIYLLSHGQRAKIGNDLFNESRQMFGSKGRNPFCSKRISIPQIRRCLSL